MERYQATQWGGHQAMLYGQASTTRFAADASSTRGGQVLVADATMFTAWLQARSAGETGLEADLVRRFSPEYRTAFQAWLKTHPFDDASAPAGPGYMPGFTQPDLVEADHLNAQASELFEQGTEARETANKYVRDTVLFASVLFLAGLAQRFKDRRVKTAAIAVAFTLLAFTLVTIVTLPRA
ncbi:MAG: hypothetical protein M3P43_18230 [Actinomycetota bacterium]|nr:hypothetical protein [Actinomycetota bacterium]